MNRMSTGAAPARAARWAAGMLLAAGWLGLPPAAAAQTGGPTLVVNSCDSAAYPQVTCIVTPLNTAGVPLQDLSPSAFEVIDGATAARDVKVEQIENGAARTSYMLVVDFGTSAGSPAIAALKDAARGILTAVEANDRVALIGITGPIEVDGEKVNPAKESGFVNALSNRNDIINIITRLNAVRGTPLYDAVCKGLLLTARENLPGNRALIVLSDGRDATSAVCKADDPITRAVRDRIPVFTIGVGTRVDEGYLKRLALQTDGGYQNANDNAAVTPAFRKIQSVLKTQYRVSFTAAAEADNKPHAITLRLNHPSGRATERGEYTALFPIAPTLDLVVRSDGADLDLGRVPAGAEIRVEPSIRARQLARVEYVLNGQVTVVDALPFAFSFRADQLVRDRPNELVVRAVGDPANPQSITSKTVTLSLLPEPTPTPTPDTGIAAVVARNPALLAAAGVGVLALLGLAVVLATRGARRRVAPISPVAPIDMTSVNVPTMVTGFGDDRTHMVGADAGDSKTMVFGVEGAAGADAPKTMVFRPGIAVLEITSGATAGQRLQLGVPGEDIVQVGRKYEGNTCQVQLDSPFVSRKHAKVYAESGTLYVVDLDSSSGTKVNGERVSRPTALKVGDVIEFADIRAEIKPLS